jgi:UDP-N-acetylglucosamine 2-epimerase (non-hydrolysing)
MSLPEVHLIGGTRPEAVKLAPVALAMRAAGLVSPVLVASGQHPAMVTQALAAFDLTPDVTLRVERGTGSQAELLTEMIRQLDALSAERAPAAVLVQGDTTTSLAGALAAFWRRIPVVHLEAGLRSGDLTAPFPEEANRRLIGVFADLHLAPTPRAAAALRTEAAAAATAAGTTTEHDDRIVLTGNTVVDALRWMLARIPEPHVRPAGLPPSLQLRDGAPLVLVTGHRRESFASGLAAVCTALHELAIAHPEVDIVYPVHLNPQVQQAVRATLAGVTNVQLCAPLDYEAAIWSMRRSRFVVTDSGGIQEEAPELGKPVLVTRVATERPEAAERGMAIVVGYDAAAITRWANLWLSDDEAYRRAVPTCNPFGDGRAAERCVAALRARLGLPVGDLPPPWTG